MTKVKRKIFKVLENIICILATILIYSSLNPGLMIIGIPLLLVTSSKIVNIIGQNKIKDSIFMVSNKGVIKQNSLASPMHFIKILCSKNKEQVFMDETEKMFKQLPRINKNGEVIRYSTISHALTFKLLKGLETEGYITNLVREKYKSKKLLFEKLLIGNTGNINKKYQMYKIGFELTDKKYINGENVNTEIKQNTKQDTPQVTDNRRQEIAELTALKNQLLSKENESNTNIKKRM